jgi:hypothetical protein
MAQDCNPDEAKADRKPFAPPDLAPCYGGNDSGEQRHGGHHDGGRAGADGAHPIGQHAARQPDQHRADEARVADFGGTRPDRVAARSEHEEANPGKQIAQAGHQQRRE